MRDYRDSKTMAKALRRGLAAEGPAVDDYLAGRTDAQLGGYPARAEKMIAEENEALEKLGGDPEAFPEFLKRKTGAARARERGVLQRRLREQLAQRRRSIDLVAAALAARE